MDPLLVRLLIPLGIVTTLFFIADFVVTSKWLARNAGRATVVEGRRSNRILAVAGPLLIAVLGVIAAITFAYRSEVSMQRVREVEAQAPHDRGPREALKRRVRLECVAFFGPVVVGSISGLVLGRLGRRWRFPKPDAAGQGVGLEPQ